MIQNNHVNDNKLLFDNFIISYENLYFTMCKKNDLEKIINYAEVIRYSQGSTIYFENDEVKYFYLLLNGKVEITKTTDTDLSRTFAILSPGDTFGIQELFFKRHNVTATAYEQVIVGRIKKNDFFENLSTINSFMIDCLRTTTGVLAECQDEMVIYKPDTKLIVFVYWLSQSYGINRGTTIYITKTHTHEEIAEILSLSRETVTRTMNLLKKQNLISIEKKHIIICDLKKLEELKTHKSFIGLYGRIDYKLC
ncbi:MAG: hypothetical protein A2355_02455 [Spirochaetes bacterium RIFOXYB1_FULL_32_8]|nr:MAG: hypothetical protein A2355_02455 [Spirochaetes bacterium RIFOXYB1_FULL_32_8]